MADRYEALEAYIHTCIEAALNDTRPEAYEELMPVLETSGSRLKKYFVRVLIEQFDRAVASESRAHNLPQKLAEIDAAEERARVRQRKWFDSPSMVRQDEHPVILPRLTTRELVDCQLRDARQKWLVDLHKRLSEAQRASAESRSRIEQQSATVNERMARIQQRLTELQKARDALSLNKGSSE